MPVVDSTQRADGHELTILVEVDEPSRGVTDAYDRVETRGEALDRAVAVARDVFGEGLDLARSCAARVAHSISEFDKAAKPNEVEVQLAIKLDAELGAFIAKSSAGAQLQVSMKWVRPASP